MTLKQAIQEFISALELTENERSEASRQHTNLRDGLAAELDLDPDYNTFLTGSYARSTATRPLNDIDVFCVLVLVGADARLADALRRTRRREGRSRRELSGEGGGSAEQVGEHSVLR